MCEMNVEYTASINLEERDHYPILGTVRAFEPKIYSHGTIIKVEQKVIFELGLVLPTITLPAYFYTFARGPHQHFARPGLPG